MATDLVNGANGDNGHAPSVLVSVNEFVESKYDYVIVGGGTAGLVLAARLTENPDVTVGVIEAGKNRLDDELVFTPALFTQLLFNPEYDWMLSSVPQVISALHLVMATRQFLTNPRNTTRARSTHCLAANCLVVQAALTT